MESYNLRIKTFPDGVKQYFYSSKLIIRGRSQLQDELEQYLREHWWESDPDTALSFVEYEASLHDGSSVSRKEHENMVRAKQAIYELARCSSWDWFVTLTFDDTIANGWRYEECSKALRAFADLLGWHGRQWLFVPEQHKSGRFHFHGLVRGGELKVAPAINPYTNYPMLDKSGRQIYNILNYKLGFSTATRISDSRRAAAYICKYLTKDIVVPKGRNRYWASRSLARPEVEFGVTYLDQLMPQLADSTFAKSIETQWGNFLLFETKGG